MTRFILIFLVFVPGLLFSQEWSKPTKKADLVYDTREYFKAYNLYKASYKEAPSKTEKSYISFQMAMCLKFMNQTVKAESAFLRAISRNYSDPIVYFYYAEMLKKNTKYTEAAQNYEEYSKRVPDDPRGTEAAVGCRMAAEWLANPTRYVIENRKEINSKESEFAAIYASPDYETIYFTSTRTGFHGNKINPVTGENYSDIFETTKDRRGDWSKPEALLLIVFLLRIQPFPKMA
jgi:peptidoglycan-associated lipoprotein